MRVYSNPCRGAECEPNADDFCNPDDNPIRSRKQIIESFKQQLNPKNKMKRTLPIAQPDQTKYFILKQEEDTIQATKGKHFRTAAMDLRYYRDTRDWLAVEVARGKATERQIETFNEYDAICYVSFEIRCI